MTSTLDRFQLLEFSQLQGPHRCAVCGSFSGDGGKKFIDFGLYVDFYGTVYICTGCFIGASSVVGYASQAKYSEALTQITEYQAVVASLIDENRSLRNAMDSLRTLDRPNPDTYSTPNPSEQEVKRQPDLYIEATAELNKGITERESRSSESADVGGSKDVRSDDSQFTDSITALGLNI